MTHHTPSHGKKDKEMRDMLADQKANRLAIGSAETPLNADVMQLRHPESTPGAASQDLPADRPVEGNRYTPYGTVDKSKYEQGQPEKSKKH
jgi:hypothetical protein